MGNSVQEEIASPTARNDITFVTDSPVTFFLIAPNMGRFLFVLYRAGYFFCHRFTLADYDAIICEVT
jgi:hypothetical protein